MTWPTDRVTRTALFRMAEDDYSQDRTAGRRRGVRRKTTRAMVRGGSPVPRQRDRRAAR